MDRPRSSRDFVRISSAVDWFSAAGAAAVLPRFSSADRIDAPARIRSFRKATPTSPSRAEASERLSVAVVVLGLDRPRGGGIRARRSFSGSAQPGRSSE